MHALIAIAPLRDDEGYVFSRKVPGSESFVQLSHDEIERQGASLASPGEADRLACSSLRGSLGVSPI
jgi:hypothetical protein